MKLTFLGTGTSQGVPVIGCDCSVCRSADSRDQRLRCSVLFSNGDANLLVDAGPDFRQQMLREEVKRLDAILLTHEHNDHIIGMDDVRPFNFSSGRDMPVYASERVKEDLKVRFAYIFDHAPYPGAPRLSIHSIDKDQAFCIHGIEVLPIEVWHGKIPVLGFRIGDCTYITDANKIAAAELEKAHGSDILVLNALHHRKHHSHFNLKEALEMVEILQPRRAFFTHISHNMGQIEDINARLPEHVQLAYDGLCLDF